MVAIEHVLARHGRAWMALPGVVGAGIGRAEGRPCITVLVVQATSELRHRIPTELDGYPIRIVETGRVRARRRP